MKRTFRMLLMAFVVTAVVACGKDEPYDPAKGDGNGHGTGVAEPAYTVDKDGYATYEYKGFTFKVKNDVVKTEGAQKAVSRMKSDLDKIMTFVPADILKVMQKNPIWMEKHNEKNSSAAWYHRGAGSGLTYGGLAAKEKCVEITNYDWYVDWTSRNQPMMVFHELCHLYHDQGLGGSSNTTIMNAYKAAKNSGIYKEIWYRTDASYNTEDKWTKTTSAYCMNDDFEYFSEMCEAYWGENDYYPFNYMQLKDFDKNGYNMCVKIWGERF